MCYNYETWASNKKRKKEKHSIKTPLKLIYSLKNQI